MAATYTLLISKFYFKNPAHKTRLSREMIFFFLASVHIENGVCIFGIPIFQLFFYVCKQQNFEKKKKKNQSKLLFVFVPQSNLLYKIPKKKKNCCFPPSPPPLHSLCVNLTKKKKKALNPNKGMILFCLFSLSLSLLTSPVRFAVPSFLCGRQKSLRSFHTRGNCEAQFAKQVTFPFWREWRDKNKRLWPTLCTLLTSNGLF